MINILKEHLASYPDMQIQDVAKLLYQSEFGGGHMIADAEKSLKRIQEEYHSLDSPLLSELPIIESIGDGMYRIYLSILDKGLRAEVLNEIFVQSANHKQGSLNALEDKIGQILMACQNHELPYSKNDVQEFFASWKAQGYPAISHSDIYREAYHPAYRVIDESYLKICEIVPQVTLRNDCVFVIAIDGMSGSGKSTLGGLLHINFPNSNLFHMDNYFLRPHQRTPERLSEIGGNVDYERFKEEILLHLNDKNGLTYRPYNCCTQSLESEIHVPWKPIIIIEGSYSQHPYFGNLYDLKLFCEITKEEQKRRIIKRNGEKMWNRFENEWIPKENAYFELFHIREKSGLL